MYPTAGKVIGEDLHLCLTKRSTAYWRNWRILCAACTWSREEGDNISSIVVMTVKMELIQEYGFILEIYP